MDNQAPAVTNTNGDASAAAVVDAAAVPTTTAPDQGTDISGTQGNSKRPAEDSNPNPNTPAKKANTTSPQQKSQLQQQIQQQLQAQLQAQLKAAAARGQQANITPEQIQVRRKTVIGLFFEAFFSGFIESI
jgi:hypothetical protein